MNNDRVTYEEIAKARRAPLADFLLSHFPGEFYLDGRNVRNRNNPGFSVAVNVSGYNDFETGAHGNPIDFLMKYKGYTFQRAVRELNAFLCNTIDSSNKLICSRTFAIPANSNGDMSDVYCYLETHAIPVKIATQLFEKGLLYQDTRKNAVFITKESDYCELYGTGPSYYYRCLKTAENRFWMLAAEHKPRIAYICETALEALSLRCIREKETSISIYVSIGGPNAERAIERISSSLYTILAFRDNETGRMYRKIFSDLQSIYPQYETWNEDLLHKCERERN